MEFTKKIEAEIFKSKQELFNFTVGLIGQKIISDLKELLGKIQPKSRPTMTKTRKILNLASNKFQKKFKEIVWNYRCEKRIEIDKIKGINTSNKRKKPSERITKRGDTGNKEDESTIRIQRKPRNPLKTKPREKDETQERVYNWVREGRKWLGL